MLKIVSWNVRGMESRRRIVKEVLRQEDLDIFIFMETKRSEFCRRRVSSIWKCMRVEREVLEAEGLSGGILVLWNLRSCVAFEVICGRPSITIAFMDGEGVEFWVTSVYGPPREGVGICFGRSWKISLVIMGRDGVWRL